MSRHLLEDFGNKVRFVTEYFRGCKVPINTLFLASLVMTALLYAYCMLLFFAKAFWFAAGKHFGKVEKHFLRRPIAVSSFFLGLLLFVVVEVILLFWIRDSLLLEIVMLIHPFNSIKGWQMGQ